MLVSVNDKSLYTLQVLNMQLCTRASSTESWLVCCMLAVSILRMISSSRKAKIH